MLETTKPPKKIQVKTRWVSKIRLWGFVVGKTKHPDRDPNILGYSELIWRLRRRRRVLVERRILRDESGFENSWGFAAEPFAKNLGQLKTHFYFWYSKGLILNPPNIRLSTFR
jgi:hypothetical protein